MIFFEVFGILFMVDLIILNCKFFFIDVSFGLGEVFVFGLVFVDLYIVWENIIMNKIIVIKKFVIYSLKEGGMEICIFEKL